MNVAAAFGNTLQKLSSRYSSVIAASSQIPRLCCYHNNFQKHFHVSYRGDFDEQIFKPMKNKQ